MAGRFDLTQVDPGMLAFYKALVERTPPGSEHWPLDEQRAAWSALCKAFRAERPAGLIVEDVAAHGVPCRLFRPKTDKPVAGVIYGHGGGWVLGGLDTHDDMCAEMAAGAGVAVALMDYRLAPEHPYPAQLEDSLKVWRWMHEQGGAYGIDCSRLIAAGDSAGGQMSVALALTLRELHLPQVKAMVLIYPVLGANTETASYLRNAEAPCLSKNEMKFYLRAFLGPEESPAWRDEKAVPNLVQDVSGLPPAFITVAAHDPLYDDGVIFHEKLLAGGVPSVLRREPKLAHSYMRARHHSAVAMEGFQSIVSALRAFAAPS